MEFAGLGELARRNAKMDLKILLAPSVKDPKNYFVGKEPAMGQARIWLSPSDAEISLCTNYEQQNPYLSRVNSPFSVQVRETKTLPLSPSSG